MTFDFFKDFINYIAEEASLTVGDNLFLGPIPEAKDDTSAGIIPTGGVPETTTGDYSPEQPTFQVYTRGKYFPEAQAMAEKIHRAIHEFTNALMNPIHVTSWVYTIQARGRPVFIGFDTKNRYMFSQNFEMIKEAEG